MCGKSRYFGFITEPSSSVLKAQIIQRTVHGSLSDRPCGTVLFVLAVIFSSNIVPSKKKLEILPGRPSCMLGLLFTIVTSRFRVYERHDFAFRQMSVGSQARSPQKAASSIPWLSFAGALQCPWLYRLLVGELQKNCSANKVENVYCEFFLTITKTFAQQQQQQIRFRDGYFFFFWNTFYDYNN